MAPPRRSSNARTRKNDFPRARAMRQRGKNQKAGHLVSPLAPKVFPDLPEIDGVRFATVAAGIKYEGRADVMLAEIAPGSSIAGTFTRSATRSAPVLWCQAALASFDAKADKPIGILVNSGNANAFTGKLGTKAVSETTTRAAKKLKTTEDRIFPASTGVIGEPLPADRITRAIDDLVDDLSPSGAENAARAIMTTDTFPKGASRTISVDGKEIKIIGFAKGSGMIAPDMATMLVYIFTDAAVDQTILQSMVSGATPTTFNSITVDSDTSTSDTLIVAATGRAANKTIKSVSTRAARTFSAALTDLMRELAHLVVRDGEGATKFVQIRVDGATTEQSARVVALAIANSPLVKTAIAGEDPNWGRVVMAIGKSGEPADRDRISIKFGDILVAKNGWVAASYSEDAGAEYMKRDDIDISVSLGVGDRSATVWTCDLTHGYITINADYRS